MRGFVVLILVVALAGSAVAAPYSMPDDVLIVDLTINGKQVKAIVDTGAGFTVLDAVFEKELGTTFEPLEVSTPRGQTKARLYKSPEIQLHGSAIGVPQVAVVDLELMRRVGGVDFRAMLGRDYLTKHVLRLNFRRREMEILPDCPTPPQMVTTLQIVPGWQGFASIDLRLPAVGVKRFVIDTGSIGTSGTLVADQVEDLRQSGQLLHVSKSAFADLAGDHQAAEVMLQDPLECGALPLSNVFFDESRMNLLGMAFWSRFDVVTFDFPKNKLHLEAGSNLNRPDVTDRSGLRIWKVDGQVRVFESKHGSPAESAGFSQDDVLTHINGQPIETLTLLRVRDLLSGPVTQVPKLRAVKLQFVRSGAQHSATLPLDVWPEPPRLLVPSKRLPD